MIEFVRKLIICLLIPLLFQCAKEPLENKKPTTIDTTTHQVVPEKKCYLTRVDDPANDRYYLYERDSEDKLVKMACYFRGELSSYVLYTYNGVNIQKEESFFYGLDWRDNTYKSDLYEYNLYSLEGNKFTLSNFQVNKGEVTPWRKSIYELGPDSAYKKVVSYSYDKATDEWIYKGYRSYEYHGIYALTCKVYDTSNVLRETYESSIDTKKNIMLNYSIFPLESKHNICTTWLTKANGEESISSQISYTYNIEGYPITSTNFNSPNLTKYTY